MACNALIFLGSLQGGTEVESSRTIGCVPHFEDLLIIGREHVSLSWMKCPTKIVLVGNGSLHDWVTLACPSWICMET